jgi:hypothetical protein
MSKKSAKKTTEVKLNDATEQSSKPNGKVVEPVTPVVVATPAPAPAQPNKQAEAIAKLKDGWLSKGISLDKLVIRDDGKYKMLVVAPNWPTVRVGGSGGITVMELKSYTSAYLAALDGLNLYQRQLEREAKRAVAQPAAPTAEKAPAKQTA